MSAQEFPVVIECVSDRLVGIFHPGDAAKTIGVVFVVGGPQSRVGSHRQFVLMARRIAAVGFPVLRFDYRGMGDSEGAVRSFEKVDEDIRAAIDRLFSELPSLDNVVLLGLCDAASAALIYCLTDDRLRGLVLLNPWVRTEQSEARAYLKHYYWRRLLQASFWKKIVSGNLDVSKAMYSFIRFVRRSRSSSVTRAESVDTEHSFIQRMQTGFEQFKYPILLLVSGRDLTASEFLALCRSDSDWHRASSGLLKSKISLPTADHTFSTRRDLDYASSKCIDWLLNQVLPR